jgi:hypothetical protein
MGTATGRRPVGVAAMLVLFATALIGCGVGGHCEVQTSVDPTAVTFDGTVVAVGDDGAVQLAVESVVPRDTSPRTDPTIFGVPHDTLPPVLDTVVAGATVTVQFPADQVEHLRRDLGEVYRVWAWSDPTTGTLTTQLDDLKYPCGPTKLADE